MEETVRKRLKESADMKYALLSDDILIDRLCFLSQKIVSCMEQGGKLAVCGNGGSATDALHFSGEMVGRFQRERRAWPVMALNADIAAMTSVANDYGYDDVYVRQVQAYLKEGDIIIGISTSGNSENVFRAVRKAREMGIVTAALLGGDGGKIGKSTEIPVIVPGRVTARIQEVHITLIHILCELVEERLCRR